MIPNRAQIGSGAPTATSSIPDRGGERSCGFTSGCESKPSPARLRNITFSFFDEGLPAEKQNFFETLTSNEKELSDRRRERPPQRLENSLVTDGYIPEARAMLCRKEWTQLNYGWWTVLEPHLTDSYKKETNAAREQARKDLEDENKALPAKIRKIRGGQ